MSLFIVADFDLSLSVRDNKMFFLAKFPDSSLEDLFYFIIFMNLDVRKLAIWIPADHFPITPKY